MTADIFIPLRQPAVLLADAPNVIALAAWAVLVVIITGLALATALFQSTVTQYLRRLMPHIKNVSAVALIIAGIYLIYY